MLALHLTTVKQCLQLKLLAMLVSRNGTSYGQTNPKAFLLNSKSRGLKSWNPDFTTVLGFG